MTCGPRSKKADAEALSAADDAMQRMQAAGASLGKVLARELAPAITDAANATAHWVSRLGDAENHINSLDIGQVMVELEEAQKKFVELDVAMMNIAPVAKVNNPLVDKWQADLDEAQQRVRLLIRRRKELEGELYGTGELEFVKVSARPITLDFEAATKSIRGASQELAGFGSEYGEVLSLLQASRTPQEEYLHMEMMITNAAAEGVITFEQYQQAMRANSEALASATSRMEEFRAEGSEGMIELGRLARWNQHEFQALQQNVEAWSADFIVNMATGKATFTDFADHFIKELIRMATMKAIGGIVGFIGSLFGGGGGGGFSFGNMLGSSTSTAVTAQTGGATQFFATPFGGARASGGPVSRGKTYLVGEEGPEWLAMGEDGYVTPNDRLGRVTVPVHIDARGASAEAAAVFLRMAPGFAAQIKRDVLDALERGVMR